MAPFEIMFIEAWPEWRRAGLLAYPRLGINGRNFFEQKVQFAVCALANRRKCTSSQKLRGYTDETTGDRPYSCCCLVYGAFKIHQNIPFVFICIRVYSKQLLVFHWHRQITIPAGSLSCSEWFVCFGFMVSASRGGIDTNFKLFGLTRLWLEPGTGRSAGSHSEFTPSWLHRRRISLTQTDILIINK